MPLIDGGAFAGVDAAMMVHPADADLLNMDVVALHQAHVTYTGEAAHAAAAPHKGRNALDAAVLGYMNVAALRQHIESGERIHGIITDGGDKPNIVPAHTRSRMDRAVDHRGPARGAEGPLPRLLAGGRRRRRLRRWRWSGSTRSTPT